MLSLTAVVCNIAVILLLYRQRSEAPRPGLASAPRRSDATPGHGTCYGCGRSWDKAKEHATPFEWSKPMTVHMLATGEDVSITNFSIGEAAQRALAERIWTRACFPLCEVCWLTLKTPEARMPYYRRLLDDWRKKEPDREELWPAISNSVAQGN